MRYFLAATIQLFIFSLLTNAQPAESKLSQANPPVISEAAKQAIKHQWTAHDEVIASAKHTATAQPSTATAPATHPTSTTSATTSQ
jgi:hypothetical protein